MKRFLLSILCLLLLCSTAAAYTDSFSGMNNDEDYQALLDVIKNGGSAEAAENAYMKYISKNIDDISASRTEYQMVRYYVDTGNEEKAEEHLDKERSYYNAALSSDASELEIRTAEADLISAEYYLTGKMGTGMESSKLTKNLYKDYPNEFYIAIQEAFRLLYTPPIAGGNSKKALRIINDVESNAEGISRLDYYSMLVAKAMALSKTDEYDESDEYLDRAQEIYTFDNAVEDIRKNNRRGR
ncbi:MAG TPA: hypothetical protein IAA76_00655 [Candidatus Ornithospirochaeta stercorigallinarum]|nr:hypothetical protein [Candidatus Ornithospirochaeta stercorigallinarum]